MDSHADVDSDRAADSLTHMVASGRVPNRNTNRHHDSHKPRRIIDADPHAHIESDVDEDAQPNADRDAAPDFNRDAEPNVDDDTAPHSVSNTDLVGDADFVRDPEPIPPTLQPNADA